MKSEKTILAALHKRIQIKILNSFDNIKISLNRIPLLKFTTSKKTFQLLKEIPALKIAKNSFYGNVKIKLKASVVFERIDKSELLKKQSEFMKQLIEEKKDEIRKDCNEKYEKYNNLKTNNNIIMRNFFWFCSGVNRRLLLDCDTDFAKYFTIGATVFFTAVFAAISSCYAMYFVFSGSPYAIWASIGFGLVWGLTIFNIDRYLVLSLKKENKPFREFFTALPRLLLAILIGFVIARPLELKIFDKEIKEGLKQYYLDNQTQLNELKQNKFKVQFKYELDDLANKKVERNTAFNNWENAKTLQLNEANGVKTGLTSGQVGWKKKTLALQGDIDKKQSIYDSLDKQVAILENKITNARNTSKINEVNQVDDASLDLIVQNAGFYDRNKILGQISSWTPFSSVGKTADTKNTQGITLQGLDGENDKTVFFISLLFIFVECLPVIVKLLSKRGMYDIRLEEEEERIRFLSKQETFANKHLINTLGISQRDVMEKAIGQWRENEMNSSDLGSRYVNNDDEN